MAKKHERINISEYVMATQSISRFVLYSMFALLCFFACTSIPVSQPPGTEPVTIAPSPKIRRITSTQYQNAYTSIFGEDLLFPSGLEPDIERYGLQEIGASITQPLCVLVRINA